jgi:hypothetical protein
MDSTQRSYGTWCNRVNVYASSPDADVDGLVDTGDPEWRERLVKTGALDLMRAEYRQAIDDALPPDVALCGEEFIGPAMPERGEFDGYPRNGDGHLDFAAMVEDIDVAAIVHRHDPDA